eukprot:611185-Amphidinium_carterae.1
MDKSVPLDYVVGIRKQMLERLEPRRRGASRDRQRVFQLYSSLASFARDDIAGMDKILQEQESKGLSSRYAESVEAVFHLHCGVMHRRKAYVASKALQESPAEAERFQRELDNALNSYKQHAMSALQLLACHEMDPLSASEVLSCGALYYETVANLSPRWCEGGLAGYFDLGQRLYDLSAQHYRSGGWLLDTNDIKTQLAYIAFGINKELSQTPPNQDCEALLSLSSKLDDWEATFEGHIFIRECGLEAADTRCRIETLQLALRHALRLILDRGTRVPRVQARGWSRLAEDAALHQTRKEDAWERLQQLLDDPVEGQEITQRQWSRAFDLLHEAKSTR